MGAFFGDELRRTRICLNDFSWFFIFRNPTQWPQSLKGRNRQSAFGMVPVDEISAGKIGGRI
jgi:hypothetical protein